MDFAAASGKRRKGESGNTDSSDLPPSSSASSAAAASAPSSASDPLAARIRATASKACGYCALTGCEQCIEASRRTPPTSCHVPEHSRSVCSACTAAHRSLSIPLSRTMAVPLGLHDAFEQAFNASRVAMLSDALQDWHVDDDMPVSFRYFYTHLNGTARLFEIFDATDTQLWETPLAFAHVYVFESARKAERVRFLFPQYLRPIAPSTAPSIAQSGPSSDLMQFCIWCVPVWFCVSSWICASVSVHFRFCIVARFLVQIHPNLHYHSCMRGIPRPYSPVELVRTAPNAAPFKSSIPTFGNMRQPRCSSHPCQFPSPTFTLPRCAERIMRVISKNSGRRPESISSPHPCPRRHRRRRPRQSQPLLRSPRSPRYSRLHLHYSLCLCRLPCSRRPKLFPRRF
jgi:hypothetical protein